MSEHGNAFQRAAEALAEVRDLVLQGDQLRQELGQIVDHADASSKRVEQVLKAETATLSKSTQDVLGQYRTAAKEVVGGTRAATEQLEATTAQIRATAISSVTELKDRADTAIKRVVAEVTIAHDRFEKAAKTVESAAGDASKQIAEASRRVDHGTSLHSNKLEEVSRRLGDVLTAFEVGATAIASAERDIRIAKDETVAARAETSKAKDEVVALSRGMRKQIRVLFGSVLMLFFVAVGALAWAYWSSSHAAH